MRSVLVKLIRLGGSATVCAASVIRPGLRSGPPKARRLLEYAHRPLGAQRLLGLALVGLDLIDGKLELPAGVVGNDDLLSGGEIRVQ